jgi:hypothetical protein
VAATGGDQPQIDRAPGAAEIEGDRRSPWRDECRGSARSPQMPALRDTQPGGGGSEAQLTDALHELIVHGGRVLAVPLPAGRRRQVIGSPKSYRAAFLECALNDRRFGGSRRARAQLLDG